MTPDTIHIGQKVFLPLRDTVHHTITIIQKGAESAFSDRILENSITILIALIAGMVALYQVKSNIVSSARIKWIEELRHEISQLYNDSLGTILYWGIYNESKENVDYDKYDLAHSNFFILSNRIKMKININEEKHKELDQIIMEVAQMLEPEEIEKYKQEDIEIKLKKIVIISREIFKKEWDRSKRIFKI
jgi:hypothetical protein